MSWRLYAAALAALATCLTGCLNVFELRDAGAAPDGSTATGCLASNLPPEDLDGFGRVVTGAPDGAEECMVRSAAQLRACVQGVDRRIVFDVPGGVLEVDNTFRIDGANLTLAGETQPGGLTIRLGTDVTFNIGPAAGGRNNVLIRHLRVEGDLPFDRINSLPRSTTFVFLMEGNDQAVDGVAIHHVTVTGHRMAMAALGEVRNVSIQRCLFRNQLLGLAIRDDMPPNDRRRENISIHHNLFAFLSERVPQIIGRSERIELVNNLVDDWVPNSEGSEFALEVSAEFGFAPEVDVVGNHYASNLGAAGRAVVIRNDGALEPAVYFADNVFPAGETLGGSMPSARAVSDGATVTPTEGVVDDVLGDVGACVTDAGDREAVANARLHF